MYLITDCKKGQKSITIQVRLKTGHFFFHYTLSEYNHVWPNLKQGETVLWQFKSRAWDELRYNVNRDLSLRVTTTPKGISGEL